VEVENSFGQMGAVRTSVREKKKRDRGWQKREKGGGCFGLRGEKKKRATRLARGKGRNFFKGGGEGGVGGGPTGRPLILGEKKKVLKKRNLHLLLPFFERAVHWLLRRMVEICRGLTFLQERNSIVILATMGGGRKGGRSYSWRRGGALCWMPTRAEKKDLCSLIWVIEGKKNQTCPFLTDEKKKKRMKKAQSSPSIGKGGGYRALLGGGGRPILRGKKSLTSHPGKNLPIQRGGKAGGQAQPWIIPLEGKVPGGKKRNTLSMDRCHPFSTKWGVGGNLREGKSFPAGRKNTFGHSKSAIKV